MPCVFMQQMLIEYLLCVTFRESFSTVVIKLRHVHHGELAVGYAGLLSWFVPVYKQRDIHAELRGRLCRALLELQLLHPLVV